MILLLANPQARWARRRPGVLDALERALGSDGEVLAPSSLDLLRVVLPAWRDRGVTGVAVLGGDGSLGRMLGEVVRCWAGRSLPWVAPLGGGTMNTIARSVGAIGSEVDLLRNAILEARGQGGSARVSRWMLEVDGERWGFLFGNGMFARYIQAYEEGVPGHRRAAVVLARAVGSAVIGGHFARRLTEPVEAKVTVDGTWQREGRWLTVAAGTIDQVGLGFRPFYGAIEQPGHLHALAIGGSPYALAAQLRYAWQGRPMRSPDIAARVGRELKIEARGPQWVMMDGDLTEVGATTVLRVGPRLEFVVPRQMPVRAG